MFLVQLEALLAQLVSLLDIVLLDLQFYAPGPYFDVLAGLASSEQQLSGAFYVGVCFFELAKSQNQFLIIGVLLDGLL